jgi:hypothetical protein
MKLVRSAAERGPLVASGMIAAGLATMVVGTAASAPMLKVAPVVLVVVAGAVGYRSILAWQTLLGAMILIILLIPIRRYTMPGNLPFQLEPYRLLVALVFAAWVSSLLIDPRVRLQKSGLELPLMLLIFSVLGSMVVNGTRMQELGVGQIAIKQLTFLISFFIVFYLIVSLVRTREHVESLVRVLVAGGAIVALAAVVEARTGYNVFNSLSRFIPLLKLSYVPTHRDLERFGRLRVYASAQHPIALGAALSLILPLAIYTARRTRSKVWISAVVVLLMGVLSSVSRSSIVMLIAIVVVYVRHRPRDVKRFWPVLLPLALAIHFALPGTFGTLKDSFFPKGGLTADQKAGGAAVMVGAQGQLVTRHSGRLATAGPALKQWEQNPVLGYGYGARVFDGPLTNADILDDQWLGSLVDTGFLGVAAWVWLLGRFIRRMGRAAKRDDTDLGWLMTGISASVVAFFVSMFVYDAFSFIQATFLLFMLLAFGACLLRLKNDEQTAPA